MSGGAPHGHGHGHAHGHDHADGHDHDHGHSHDHGHDHHHAPGLRGWFASLGHHHDHGPPAGGDFGRAFAVGIALNLAFVIAEVGFGLAANSVALLADAGHNLSDVAGLAAAWGATMLSRRSPTAQFTYGLRGSSILAALFNAVLLLVAIGAVAWESVQRLIHPQPVAGVTVIAVAAAGIAVNGLTAWLFSRGGGDLNVRAAFAHMLSDAVVSAGVVVAGGVILLTGWTWLDPVVSLVIGLIIVVGTWGLLGDAVRLALQGVPPGVEVDAVTARLAALPGVTHVHHVHIWPTSTTETALTAHLLCPAGHPGDAFLRDAGQVLAREFGIGHATLQIEMVAGSCG